jgi:serine-type D-Ala-D-Ala carboxypeptidase
MKRFFSKSRMLAASALVIFLFTFLSANIDEPITSGWLSESEKLQANTVLLKNPRQLVPLVELERRKIAALNVGAVFETAFTTTLRRYADVKSFSLVNTNLQSSIDSVQTALAGFNTVVIQLAEGVLTDVNFRTLLHHLSQSKDVIIVAYGKANQLQFLDHFNGAVIWTPANNPDAAIYTAQTVFGGIALTAKLQQGISFNFTAGTGLSTSAIRLKYTVPEELRIESKELERPIDKIMEEALAQRATPGAVVMVVKDGKVILNKAYGNRTYQNPVATRTDDIFDLASVTKISATTIAAMRLYEQRQLRLDTVVGAYIPQAQHTNKANLTVKELLLHQAGLIPYIPFYEKLTPQDYSRDSSASYPLKVADNYYLRANYFEEVMWPRMLNSSLSSRGKYVYSDVSMYMMKGIIERITSQRIDRYVASEFYAPLGMYTAGFNPRERFPKSRIVPTEQDNYFRKTLLEGYVHDQGAAMAGGVSGHAGLFSTANDMAILFQMMLNKGTYGGKRYFSPETIDYFTAQYSNVSRRGLGFDRWDPDRTNRYPSDLASPKTYGHTGYTGTCVWVDPEYNLIYIFLSNRVHPSVSNKLSALRIRPRIQDVIYKAIKDAED